MAEKEKYFYGFRDEIHFRVFNFLYGVLLLGFSGVFAFISYGSLMGRELLFGLFCAVVCVALLSFGAKNMMRAAVSVKSPLFKKLVRNGDNGAWQGGGRHESNRSSWFAWGEFGQMILDDMIAYPLSRLLALLGVRGW